MKNQNGFFFSNQRYHSQLMLYALPMLHSCSTYQRQVVDILYKNLVIYSEGLLTLKTPKVARANVMSRCKFAADYPWDICWHGVRGYNAKKKCFNTLVINFSLESNPLTFHQLPHLLMWSNTVDIPSLVLCQRMPEELMNLCSRMQTWAKSFTNWKTLMRGAHLS